MYKKTKRRPRLVFWQMLRIIIHIFLKNHVDAGLKTGNDEVMTLFENFNYLGWWNSNSEHDSKVTKASGWIKRKWKWFKCGPQSYYEQLKSAGQFWETAEMSYSMEVKHGLWPRSCREMSIHKNTTNGRKCALATTLWTTMNYTEALQGHWVSETIRARRLRLASLCAHHHEVNASKVLFWEPQHGASIEADQKLYIDTIN